MTEQTTVVVTVDGAPFPVDLADLSATHVIDAYKATGADLKECRDRLLASDFTVSLCEVVALLGASLALAGQPVDHRYLSDHIGLDADVSLTWQEPDASVPAVPEPITPDPDLLAAARAYIAAAEAVPA